MIRSTLLALTLAAAGAAHAGNVAWSVGINAPIAPGVVVGTVLGNGMPVYAAPVYAAPVYAPAPVYVAPAPIYAPPPPPRVVYAPAPVYAEPAPVWGYPVYERRGHHHHRHDGWR